MAANQTNDVRHQWLKEQIMTQEGLSVWSGPQQMQDLVKRYLANVAASEE